MFFCFVLELMNLVGTALGLFISALAPNVTVAGILAPLIIVLFMLGGGFYQNLDKLPVFISWLQYISFIRYAFEALTINEFRCVGAACPIPRARPPGSPWLETRPVTRGGPRRVDAAPEEVPLP